MNTTHPTIKQVALYGRLMRQYGHTPEWEQLTRLRHFADMTPHRAAHYLARLLEGLTGHLPSVACGCTGRTFASQTQKHPEGIPGAPAARAV
jgi:hypothetical protein